MGSHCASVVICRASPSQKAAVVTMMTNWELRQAGGVGKGLAAWWRRKRFKLQVTFGAESAVGQEGAVAFRQWQPAYHEDVTNCIFSVVCWVCVCTLVGCAIAVTCFMVQVAARACCARWRLMPTLQEGHAP